jgi:phage terminase large subunit
MTSSIALIARVRALRKLKAQRREERRIRARNRAAGIKPAPGSVQALSTESVLHDFAERPVEFIREILGYELEVKLPPGSLTFPKKGQREGICDYQARIARAVRDHSKVAVRSGHKLGKSLVAVLIAIWWVCTREEGRVVLTAATDRQVKRVLWRELRNVCRRLKRRGINLIPEPKLDPATGCQWADGREIIGFSTKIPENAAGFSGSALLFILDEGSGIPTEIYEAFAGNMAGGAKLLALSNPTQTVGWFFEAFGVRRDFWHLEHLSIEDSPNFRAGFGIVPGLAQKAYADEVAEAYGVESPFYQVRVAGNFPLNVPNAVIGLGMVEAARERWAGSDTAGTTLELGVDVARFGDDDSAVTARRGQRLYSPRWFKDHAGLEAVVHGYDSKQVSGLVLQCMRALRKPGELVRIKIDAAGGYGGAVADELRAQQAAGEIDEFVEIIEIQVAEASSEPDKYPRLRDELWFGGRKFFNEGGALYNDPKLESELIAPKYSPTAKGQFQVEPKTETKKTLGRSPDRADSALLAIYDGELGFKVVKLPQAQGRWSESSSRGFG